MPYRTSITNLQWHDVPYGQEGNAILCNISTGHPHPFIPAFLHKRVCDLIHDLSHPSGHSTAKLLKQKFMWHGISSDAKCWAWARACIPCQSGKVTRHTELGIDDFHPPSRRFGHIHVDIVGPLPPSEGSQYLFTTIDRSTCWFEAVLISEASSSTCASALLSGWISRFGVPEHITSNHGPPFMSQL